MAKVFEESGIPAIALYGGLENFFRYYGMSLYELYGGRTGNRSFRELMVEAGLLESFEFENKEYLTKRIPALLSLDSRRLLKFLIAYLKKGIFYYTFYRSEPKKQGLTDIDHGIRSIVAC